MNDGYNVIDFASRHVLMALWGALLGNEEYERESAIRVCATKLAGWKYP